MKGNQKAEEILYEKYKIIIHNYLKSKYPKNQDIDDDVSEVMIKAIMNLEKYDINKSKFKSWIFSIAKNHMIDKWRTNTISLTGSNINCIYSYSTTGDFDLNVTNNTVSNNTNMIDINNCSYTTSYCTADYDYENCSSISYISTQLTPQDFTLLDMKYVQGYNYNEIGVEFNLTSSTVSNRINYIKTKLKKDNPEIIYE